MFINARSQLSDRQHINGAAYSTRTFDLGIVPDHHRRPPPANIVLSVHSAQGEVHAVVQESADGKEWHPLEGFPDMTAPGSRNARQIHPRRPHIRVAWASDGPAVVSGSIVDEFPNFY